MAGRVALVTGGSEASGARPPWPWLRGVQPWRCFAETASKRPGRWRGDRSKWGTGNGGRGRCARRGGDQALGRRSRGEPGQDRHPGEQRRRDEDAAVADLKDEDWENTLAINLTASFRYARACIPSMRERRWGRSSISPRRWPTPGRTIMPTTRPPNRACWA